MKRTATYLRVSSDRQAREGDSVPAQREALRTYINARPDLIFAGEYLDDGISGTKYRERSELQRLLADVKAGRIDLILVTKFDRFFRSVKDFVITQELLQEHGVDWKAINDIDFDTTTPSGRFLVTSMMAVGELEAGLARRLPGTRSGTSASSPTSTRRASCRHSGPTTAPDRWRRPCGSVPGFPGCPGRRVRSRAC